MRTTISVIALATMASLIACQQQQKTQEKKAQEPVTEDPPMYLGTVHQVFPEQKFALLRIIGPLPKAGTTVITHPANGSTARIGNLLISSDQPARNGIIAADICSGTLIKGDRVFQYRDISSHPGKEQEISTSDALQETDPMLPEQAAQAAPDNATGPDIAAPGQEKLQEGIDVTLLPEQEPASANAPKPISTPSQLPEYLKDIPKDIKDWE